MTYKKIIIFCIAIFLLLFKLSEAPNSCDSGKTCSECIRREACAWCVEPNSEKPRCFYIFSMYSENGRKHKNGCEAYIYNGNNHKLVIQAREITRIRKERFTSSSYEPASSTSRFTDEIITISPQKMNLNLRVYKEYEFTLKYSQAVDFPIDLYYLMDMSKSMSDEREKLNNLGKSFVEHLPNITKNFKLGSGSFVSEDFDSTNYTKIDPYQNISPSIGYTNIMALSENSERFHEVVKNASLSYKLYIPQKGLENLLQAIVCQQQIGWRKNATKILVYSTSSGFHYVKNRNLGRNAVPNDGECHFNENGFYKPLRNQNYPTISQISQKARENSINIIFVVTPQQIPKYQELSNHIKGSSVVELSSDSTNVLHLIREQYRQASATIEMKDNATEPLIISYQSTCLANVIDAYTPKTQKCTGLKYGDIVSFTASITATSCPEKPKDRFQTIEIHPVGVNQSLIVNVEIMYICECEN